MSERLDDLKRLGEIWEQLGELNMANETWLGSDGDCDELVYQFQVGATVVCDFYVYAPGGKFDALDATPCIAILQLVFGEYSWIQMISGEFCAVTPLDVTVLHSTPIKVIIAALEAEVERRKNNE